MKNISFDNPYWLLIAIPLFIALFVPYFIAVNKDNRNRGWIASLVIHGLIVVLVSLAAAGLVHTTVLTRTRVYVLADVSYSSEKNLEDIDAYIKQIEAKLPSNSRLGVVCFGEDAKILTLPGQPIVSVSESDVKDGKTNIADAIEYTATLFSANEIKRIILITDGFATEANGDTAAAIDRAVGKGIKIDAIYLDNNLREGDKEIQISDADYIASTYVGHKNKLNLLVESNAKALVSLSIGRKNQDEMQYTELSSSVVWVDGGVNIVNLELPSDEAGAFDYMVKISSSNDTSPYNNEFYFTQSVVAEKKVLLITENGLDRVLIQSMYSGKANVTS